MSSKAPPHGWQKDAETLFRALDGLDQISLSQNAKPVKPGFNEIFAYVHHSNHVPSEALVHALKNDLSVRRDIKALLAKKNIADLGQAIAASSGEILERETTGFKLMIKPVSGRDDQVYLIIEAIDRDDVPHFIFIEQENDFHRLEIEDYYDGQAQMLLSKEDIIFKALIDPKSHVILS